MRFIIGIFFTLFTSLIFAQDQLSYLSRPATDSTATPKLLVLLHGYGSNEKDLFTFANQFPENYLVVSPRGPIKVSDNGFAWYSVSIKNGQRIANVKQAQAAKDTLLSFLDYLKTKHLFDSSAVTFIGFSQGAIMSYSLALSAPEKIQAIAALGGRILDESKTSLGNRDQIQQLKVFIGHGTKDPVIAIEKAKEANDFCNANAITTTFKEYEIGHSISNEMLMDVLAWLMP